MRADTMVNYGRLLFFGILAVASSASAAIRSDSYLYFRCNSTSWDVNDRSRLVSSATPGVVEITFAVTQPWMTAVGDDCILTETPNLNAWGNWQKSYRAQGYPVVAPTTTELYDQTPGVIQNFRLRFPKPGSYKASVDIRTMQLTVSRLGELLPGDLMWTASGQVVLDAARNLYRITPNRTTLQKLNPATGTAVWSYTSPTSVYANPKCIESGTMFVQDGSSASVTSLSPVTGAVKWSTVLATVIDLPGVYTGGFDCPSGASTVHFGYYGTNLYGLGALNRTTGGLAWKKATTNYANIRVGTKDVIVYSVDNPDFTRTTVVGVNPANGNQLWSYTTTTDTWDWYTSDAAGNLFRTTSNNVQRVNPLTGAALWSVNSAGLGMYIVESDGLFLIGNSFVEKINKATGAVIWSLGDRSSTTYASFVFDPSGRCAQSQQNNDVTTLSSVNCATGAVEFTKSFAGNGWPSFDKQGRMYMVTQRLQQLNSTGSVVWTYLPPAIAGYGASSMNTVIDSDPGSVYVTYYGSGNYYSSATGIAALSPATGVARWNHSEPVGLSFLGSDATTLFMGEFNRGGPVQAMAILK